MPASARRRSLRFSRPTSATRQDGDDAWTRRAEMQCAACSASMLRPIFVFNGTAANFARAVGAVRHTDAVICHAFHISMSTSWRPGILQRRRQAAQSDTPHASPPRRRWRAHRTDITASNTIEAARRVPYPSHRARYDLHAGRIAHTHGFCARGRPTVPMDGARFANAVAALGCAPARYGATCRHRCAVLWRHEMGLPFARPLSSLIPCWPMSFGAAAQAGGTAGLEDAFSGGAMDRALFNGAWLRMPRMPTRWRKWRMLKVSQARASSLRWRQTACSSICHRR